MRLIVMNTTSILPRTTRGWHQLHDTTGGNSDRMQLQHSDVLVSLFSLGVFGTEFTLSCPDYTKLALNARYQTQETREETTIATSDL